MFSGAKNAAAPKRKAVAELIAMDKFDGSLSIADDVKRHVLSSLEPEIRRRKKMFSRRNFISLEGKFQGGYARFERKIFFFRTHTHPRMGEQMTRRLLTENFHCQGWCCAYFAKAGQPSLRLWAIRKKSFEMSLTFKLTLKFARWLFVLQLFIIFILWENFSLVCVAIARVMEIQGLTENFWGFHS